MSCRNYRVPRHGSLQYCPKKRSKQVRIPISSYPDDDPSKPVYMAGFLGYKAGMTHVIRTSDRARTDKKGKEMKKEIFDAVTIIETPPVVCYGIVGYKKTNTGLKLVKTVMIENLSENVIARFKRRYSRSKKFKVSNKFAFTKENQEILKNDCDVIRILVHTQVNKLPMLRTRKAHLGEMQLNGGSVEEKVEFALQKIGKEISIREVFSEQEMIDILGVTKGKGFTGVTKRFGTTILPRKSNKGRRKVGCIGAWHPANVLRTVARAGQKGFHRRTQPNKKIYMINNGKEKFSTDYDLTKKTINPMSGFLNYGRVNHDFIMVKGPVTGPSKRVVSLRKALWKTKNDKNNEKIVIKFVDTSSKLGHGRFQTTAEKQAFYGLNKKEVIN
ncbi:60S ribosomal protein L3 [Dictyocoela muelleri]|nr:60S ribosomal protein L3 [Dictyocoela muelleri]